MARIENNDIQSVNESTDDLRIGAKAINLEAPDGVTLNGLPFTQGATDFTNLGDVPPDYTYAGGNLVAVKNDETGLEFVPLPESGGPYPDKFRISPGSETLTAADQGWTFVASGGITETLPATPADGETYLIAPGSGFTVDVAFTGVMDAGVSSPLTIDRPYRFMAANLNPSPGLVWFKTPVTGLKGRGYPITWSASLLYQTGETSIRSGILYISRTDNNTGNDPLTDDGTNWFPVKRDIPATITNSSIGTLQDVPVGNEQVVLLRFDAGSVNLGSLIAPSPAYPKKVTAVFMSGVSSLLHLSGGATAGNQLFLPAQTTLTGLEAGSIVDFVYDPISLFYRLSSYIIAPAPP